MKKQGDLKAEVAAILKPIREQDPSRFEELMSGAKELRKLHDVAVKSKQDRNPLLIGSKLERLRFLFTGNNDALQPQTETGRRWGKFLKVYLQDAGLSETTSYRRLDAWQSAKSLGIPEPVLLQIAQDQLMLGVGIDRDNPLGKRYTAAAVKLASKFNFNSPERNAEFIESLFKTEAPATNTSSTDILVSMHNSTLSGIRRMMKVDGRDATDPKAVEKYLFDHVSNLLLAFDCKNSESFDTANEFPTSEFQTWEVTISKNLAAAAQAKEREDSRGERAAKRAERQPDQRDRKARREARTNPKTAKKTAKPTTTATKPTRNAPLTPHRTATIHGYFAEMNRKPKHESTPWEIFDEENPGQVLARFRSSQDAEMELKKLRDKRAEARTIESGGNNNSQEQRANAAAA